MKYILYILFFLGSLQLPQVVYAQSSSPAQKEAQVLLEQARKQMAAEDYTAANRSFRKMLELNTVLPSEMCFFFANTLYQLGQFDNSLRFVEKYQMLAGPAGEYYAESQELKGLLDEQMLVIRNCQYCDSQGYVLEDCHYCEGEGHITQVCPRCYGQEKIKCETCKGEGVVIEKNHFGQKTYQTCPRCEGDGIQKCSLCEGKGEVHTNCRYCGGSGRTRTSQICNHPQAAQ